MKTLIFLLSLVASISFAAEEKCKKRDLTSDELSQVNSCLNDVTKSSKRSVKFFYDLSGNLYGVEAEKGSATLYSEKGSLKSRSEKLSCNTDRTMNVGSLLVSLVFDDEKANPSKELHRAESPTLASFNRCRQMMPNIKCATTEIHHEIQDLMFRLQQLQNSSGGAGGLTAPANSNANPGTR